MVPSQFNNRHKFALIQLMNKDSSYSPFFGVAAIVVAAIIPLLLWNAIEPISSRFSGYAGTMLSLGQIFGLLGIVLYSINLIMASRMPFIDKVFVGLNRAYIFHHLIGGTAFLFILFHPIMMSARLIPLSVKEAALIFVPTIQDFDIAFGIIALLTMMGALVFTYWGRLEYETWKNVHRFLAPGFLLAGLHVYFISSDVSASMPLRVYILGFIAAGVLSYAYRLFGLRLFRHIHGGTLQEVNRPGPDTVELKVKLALNRFNYKAGQFVFFRTVEGDIRGEWHPFSLTSSPGENAVSIVAKDLGDYTKAMFDLKPGLACEIEGPYGAFTLERAQTDRQIWIAGGIGLTPFIGLSKALAASEFPRTVDFFYSVAKKEQAVYLETFKQLTSKWPTRFRFHLVVSSESGMLTAARIAELCPVKESSIYICGPVRMMRALRQQFNGMGVPNRKIFTEEFSLES